MKGAGIGPGLITSVGDGVYVLPRSLHSAVRAKDARTAPVGMTVFVWRKGVEGFGQAG
jgi:hypothetical protein